MKIILDAMGGDNAPQAAVEGAVLAAQHYGCDILLVGDRARVEPILAGREPQHITLVHASEVVEMEDKPSTVLRQKKDSSMAVGLRLLAEGQADAMISAGSTGALLTGATLTVKRIRGVRRAALGTMVPQKTGSRALLLDCGANAECTPEYLLQFALMGSLYQKTQCGVDRPRVALVNNGTEEGKGDPLRQETYALLRQADARGELHFAGNIEGREIFSGAADVLVCDGFTGNILLKTVEGTAGFLLGQVKDILMATGLTKLAALTLKPGLRRLKSQLDYRAVGGAPLLGISRPVIKAHGSSDAQAFCSAFEQTILFSHSGFIAQVADSVATLSRGEEKAEK